MSLNSTVQSLAMGLATALAGFIASQGPHNELLGYDQVGYVAIAANLLAMAFASRIVQHGMTPKAGG